MIDKDLIKTGWHCLCPKCRKVSIYQSALSLNLKDRCDHCELNLQKNDSADGPAVFLIFVLGTTLVPLAIAVDLWISPPLWAHAVIWSVATLFLTVGSLRPLKAYIIALQFKHCPQDWKS